MSILIKGMEMPKNCLLCYCTDTEYGECCLDPEKRCPEDYRQRAEWCPIMELPPHGRLIDADALMNKLQALYDEREDEARYTGSKEIKVSWNDAVYKIIDALTIIPAEEGE